MTQKFIKAIESKTLNDNFAVSLNDDQVKNVITSNDFCIVVKKIFIKMIMQKIMHLLINETDSHYYYCYQQFFSMKALFFKVASNKILKINTRYLHSLKLYLFDALTCISTA